MEFQAIVLAGGKGTRMTDLSTTTLPKCLLPIGNKPMIWYPIRMLEKAGFTEINIITLDSIKTKLETELKQNYGIKSNLHIVGIDDSNDDDDFGTANSLYLLKDKIKTDCVIVSCDLISNVCIQQMANFYRLNNASFLMHLADNIEQALELPVPGSKGKYVPERDLIGLDLQSNRVLFFGAVGESDEIKVKMSIIEKYPKINWTTKLQDSHLYIIKKCLIDYIIDNKKIFSIKSEFLPYLVKKQFSSRKPTHYENDNSVNYSNDVKSRPKIFDYIKEDKLENLINKTSVNRRHPDLLSCFAFIQIDGFCFRSNNLSVYAEANRQVSKLMQHFLQRERVDSVGRTDKQQVSSDSLIDEGTKIGDKALVKRSVIGRNCSIGEKAKITNSILMDNVKIGEGVVVERSIICSNSKLSQKSELKDCLVGYNQDIISTVKCSNETITEGESYLGD